MNPYERTASEMQRQSEGPKRFAKTAANIGIAAAATAGATSFAPILARAAPFLSQYIPEDLAIKGLSKISPKFGAFIKSAMEGGYDFNQVKDFIGNQIEESQTEQPKEQRNIIQQYAPKLHEFILSEIGKGNTPVQAAGLAKLASNKSKFGHAIKQLEKDHKIDLHSLVDQIYGNESSRQKGLKKFNQKLAKPSMLDEEIERFQNEYGQQQQGGPGQQALMGLLAQINQKLGGGQ